MQLNTQDYHGGGTALQPNPWPDDWTSGSGLVDYVRGMTADASAFWLYRADGGAVHFQRAAGLVYRAFEVIDPHGLKTTLQYDDSRLNGSLPETHRLVRVIEPAGRFLDIQWGDLEGAPKAVISSVTSGAQVVNYSYSHFPYNWYNPVTYQEQQLDWWALTSVTYANEPNTAATYTYEVSSNFSYGYCFGPVLTHADDPHFTGPMTKIQYEYLRYVCEPAQQPNPPNPAVPTWLYFYPHPLAVTGERSGATVIPGTQTGQLVSALDIECFTGKRLERTGLDGRRRFYYGDAGGSEPGGGGATYNFSSGYFNKGYELARMTNVSDAAGVGTAPSQFQRYYHGFPRRIFDARGILTELRGTEEMGSGRPRELRHSGSDQSLRTYNWTDGGASAAQNFVELPNNLPHWLFSETDERGLTTTYTRDSRRRITHIAYPDGSGEDYTYDSLTNQVTSHTLASGAIQTYEYDAAHRLAREYNSVEGLDARKEYFYDDPSHPDLIHRVVDGRARLAGAAYSTRMEYNGRNQITEVHYAPTPGGAADPHVTYEYDAYGNCRFITDELGHRSEYQYDSYRRCVRYIEPLDAVDWKGTGTVASRTWDWTYDRWIEGFGQRDASNHTKNEWRIQIEPAFNAAGDRKVTARAHDLQNRIVTESTGWIQPFHEDPDQLGDWYWSPEDGENHLFTYDPNGQKSSFTDPQGRVTTYDYDLRNRLWKTNETVNSIPRTTETFYDVTGNKTIVTFPDTRTQQWLDYTPFGQAERFIDERGNTSNLNHQWGPMKKLASVTTHRAKDGGGTEDQQTVFSYDLMGKPTQVLFPLPDGSHEDTTYEFGQIKTWRTRKGQTKTIVYDARGREQSNSWDDPSGGCDPAADTGVTPCISRSWDDANRLASITNKWSSIDFAYDAAGQMIWEGDEIAGSGGRTQTNYYRYPNGAVAHLHYPGGAFIRNDYTSRGQLAATGWDDDFNDWWRKLAAYTYRADGKVDHVDYGNGMRSALEYDPRGFIQSTDHYQIGGVNYSGRQYWRDSRDRITAFQKSYNLGANPMENGRGDRFRYDEEGQFVEGWYNATDPANSGADNWRYDYFDYDALGNRRGSDYVASRSQWMNFTRKDNGLNQYRAWMPYSYTNYDDDIGNGWGAPGAANGVLMQDGWITGGFNALNQPIQITSPAYYGTSNWVWFGYDPLGRCVKRWVGESGDLYSNPATYFHYDGWNLLEEGGNAWGPARVYAHGNRVDEMVWSYNTSTGEQAFHHYDARGHATLLTDNYGNILEQYEYDAFGWPYFFDASGNCIGAYDPVQNLWAGYSLFGNRFLFTGREWLGDLKLYDYRNRMYQPELGRFVQPDPKEFDAGDYNLYRYCHNDPINHSDPTGLDPVGRFIGELVGGYVFGTIGAEVGFVALGGTGALAGTPGGPVGVLGVGGTGAVAGAVAGGVIGTGTGIKLGGDVGDALGDKVRNIFESRGRDQGERRRQHENPNPDKKQSRDHQTGKKLPDKPSDKPRQPEPEVIPKGKEKPE